MNAVRDKPATSAKAATSRPRLSFWQIWNMSFGFLGIQFGWGLQMANMSPIYKYATPGARDSQISPGFGWPQPPMTRFHHVQPIDRRS